MHVAAPAFAGSEAFIDTLRANGVPFTPFRPQPIFTDWTHRHLALLGAELWQRRGLARLRPDLVHVFFSWTDQGLDNLWLAGRSSLPAVVSVHNYFPLPDFTDWHRRHLATAFRSLQGLYGVSQSALDRFIEIYGRYIPADAVKSVVYNFVDTSRFRPSPQARRVARTRLGLREDCILLGSVGRFDDQKKPLSLLTVFDRVRRKVPNARLLLVGDGPLKGALQEKIIELGCQDAVTLMGFQTDIENLYPAMDLHLLLSRNEGFGIVTAEAMACGVPAVGTRVPGTEEVIGNCPAGRLVALGDEAAAAEAVLSFVTLPQEQRKALAAGGRHHVEANFGIQRWHHSIAAFYAEVFSRKAAA